MIPARGRLTASSHDLSSPCWTPDGQWVWFSMRTASGRALFKVTAVGGPIQQIALPDIQNPTHPACSPDGSQVAFVANNENGADSIWVVASGGGVPSFLAFGTEPSWAPDSRTVIFTRAAGPTSNLWLIDSVTKHSRQLAEAPTNCAQPIWAR